MTEAKKSATPAEPRHEEDDERLHDDLEAERRLGRIVAVGLPVATLAAAVIVGVVASVPSALLVLASGALLGAIALLWASVRTLSGDAPLPEDLEILAAQSHDVDDLAEQKRRILRALKDIENERAIGRIGEADYEEMARRYRDDAKVVMKRMDEREAPAMAEAERLARAYVDKRTAAPPRVEAPQGAVALPSGRRTCLSCGVSNEPDAAFCKKCGAALARSEGTDATV
jgi:hypothetical protein